MKVCLSEGVISNHKKRGDTKSKPNQTINIYPLVSSHLSIPWSKECACHFSPPQNCDLMKAFSFSKMLSGREIAICRRREKGERSKEERKNEERQIQMMLEAHFLEVLFPYPKNM